MSMYEKQIKHDQLAHLCGARTDAVIQWAQLGSSASHAAPRLDRGSWRISA